MAEYFENVMCGKSYLNFQVVFINTWCDGLKYHSDQEDNLYFNDKDSLVTYPSIIRSY